MALITSYLATTKNLESFFNSLITAQAPKTFTQKFLENLEFKSTNDRLYISMLKGLGFLDANGAPTERYFKFLDQSQAKKIMAEAVREAYSDLFAVNLKAYELSAAEAKNKLRTLTQGKNSENVLGLMANRFKALVDYAEWAPVDPKRSPQDSDLSTTPTPPSQDKEKEDEDHEISAKLQRAQLCYNIQIHLPDSRDQAVYDAICKSLKKHLF